MTYTRLVSDWRIALVVAAAALAVSYLAAGSKGLIGMAMGLGGTTFSILALALLIGILGKSFAKERTTVIGTSLVVLAFLIKLPVFVVLALAVQHIGGPAPGCFLAGLGLVYLALVGWAAAPR